VLGALVLWDGGRLQAGALLLGLGAAVKFLPLLLVPWAAVAAARAGRGWRGWLSAAQVVGLGLAPLALAFAPVWARGAALDGLRERWSRGRFEHVAGAGALLARNAPAVVVYLVTSAWVLARRAPGARRATSGWIVAAGAVLVTAAGVWLPWYLSWLWAATLTRWDARHVAGSFVLFCAAVVFTLRYSVLSAGG
jgi:hypothetical protein